MPGNARALKDQDPPSVGSATAVLDSKLVHSIAHDIRSPLTAIQMCGEILGTDVDPALRDRYSRLVAQQTRAISWALEDMVALADDTLWDSAERRSVDIPELVRMCIRELREFAEERTIAFCPPPDGAESRIIGVADALRQAIRSCVQALIAAAPPDVGVSISLITPGTGSGSAPDHMVALSIRWADSQGSDRLAALKDACFHWGHVTLLAAARIVAQHGGILSELRDEGAPGIALILPAHSAPDGH